MTMLACKKKSVCIFLTEQYAEKHFQSVNMDNYLNNFGPENKFDLRYLIVILDFKMLLYFKNRNLEKDTMIHSEQ